MIRCKVSRWRYLRMASVLLFAVALSVAGTWSIAGLSFDSKIMNSVVAVIPARPGQTPRGGTGTRDAPEGTAGAVFDGGYLVTNAHVLGRAAKADIRLANGRLVAVEIVGRDLRTDLALLKATMEFPVPQTASAPKLGGRVCAIGNQFGLGLSVTCGVVSARRRTSIGFNPIEDFVQTDASVNPGGSGGALVDGEGRLVGIVSAIFTKKSDADIGVNFAAAMGLVRRLVDDLDGRSFPVASGDRAVYHAAAVVASNHLVALMGQVARLADAVGVPLDAYLDLAAGSLDNVRGVGPSAALTGPAARGDVKTVEAHLVALPADERDTYRALAAEARRLAGRREPGAGT